MRILISETYEVGSMPPSGYVAWYDWAEAQIRGGLKQKKCDKCGKFLFPQELSEHSHHG